MSVGVGYECDDGIVLAADSLFQGEDCTRDRKLWGVKMPAAKDLTYAIAAAGLDQDVRGLPSLIHERVLRIKSFNSLRDAIAEHANNYFTKVIWARPSHDYKREDEPQFLVAIRSKDRQQLFSIAGGSMAPISADKRFDSIGSGAPLANYLSETLFRPALGIPASATLAAYVVRQAKQHAPGVGGPTHIAQIPKDHRRTPSYVRAEDVALHETYLERFLAIAGDLAYYGMKQTSHHRMNAKINKLKETIANIRREILRGDPLEDQLIRAGLKPNPPIPEDR